MELTICKVLPEDSHIYAALHIDCWRDAYTGIIPDTYFDDMSAALEQRAREAGQAIVAPGDNVFLCAKDGEKMVGRLVFGKSRDANKPDAGEIGAIYLLAEYWGKGYGKKMMDYAVNALKGMGYQEILIRVLAENKRAKRFYEKYGFIFDGAIGKLDYGKPLEIVRYVLTLSPQTGITLAKAKMEDCPEIHKMQVESFKELLDKYKDYDTNPGAESLEKIEQRMAQDFTDYYFIRLNKENIGAIRVVTLNDSTCRIAPMFILPNYQGKGYARQAIQKALSLYPQAKSWELDTIKQEEKLRHLYEKMGFRQTGKEEKLKDGMDIVFYRK